MTSTHQTTRVNGSFVILITIIATIGGFLFGFDSGVINGTYDGLNKAFELTTGESTRSNFSVALALISAVLATVGLYFVRKELVWIAAILFVVFMWDARNDNAFRVASMLLGCAFGAFIAGRAADKYGRWWVLMISSILFVISAWGSGIATNSIEFICYRIICGLAVAPPTSAKSRQPNIAASSAQFSKLRLFRAYFFHF
jgi:MFS transporter, SP family, sugar:H+ symporter